MAAGDLTTLDAVKLYLDLTDEDEDDGLLSTLITSASGLFATVCGRQFTTQSYTEVRDGTGGARIMLMQTPVTAVASLTIDGRAVAASAGAPAPGFLFSPTGMLTLIGHRFARGLSNIVIGYTAGFATIPADLAQAVIEMVALRYKEIDELDVSSRALGTETTSFVVKDMRPSTLLAANAYKRVVPVGG
jgi:hypothetical protein